MKIYSALGAPPDLWLLYGNSSPRAVWHGILDSVIRVEREDCAMKSGEIKDEWLVVGENDPPPDLSREDAAFERERARLVREHPGKIALVHGDEVVGVFDDANEAILEGCRRFGSARMVFRTIAEQDETAYIPIVDVNHPSFKRLDG